jgi:hypothetical protein
MTYTAQLIQAAFEADFDDEDNGQNESWLSVSDGDGSGKIQIYGTDVDYTPVTRFGGEGQGDEAWFVIQIGDQMFRMDGYYASDYGTDWDGDLYEVKPVVKEVTFYERA